MLHPHSKVVRVGAEPGAPVEDDLRRINEFSPAPLAAGEVTVCAMTLCTGDYDRDFERFGDEVLERFAVTLVGKSLLVGHRHDAAPEGLFYRAEVVQRPGASPALRAWAYLPHTEANEHIRTLIETGVIRYVSVGFRCEKLLCDLCGSDLLSAPCGHSPGGEYGGRLATATWAGEAEAVEGSLVYLGSQYEAVLLKDAPAAEPPAETPDRLLAEHLEAALRLVAAREEEIKRLRPLADDGLRLRMELRRELHALTALAGEAEAWTALEPTLATLDVPALRELCDAVARKADWLAPPRPWATRRALVREPDLSAYVRA